MGRERHRERKEKEKEKEREGEWVYAVYNLKIDTISQYSCCIHLKLYIRIFVYQHKPASYKFVYLIRVSNTHL